VIGSGRSGTTIVLEAIACLEGVAAVPRLAGRLPATTRAAATMARLGWGPDSWLRPSSESTALFAEAGLTQAFQISQGGSITPEDAADLHMERLARRLDAVRAGGRATTAVVKNTASCARVPLLAATFPQSAFVHVVREPARVVMSLLATDFWQDMTLWWDGRTTQRYAAEEGLTPEEVAARHWARQVETALNDLADLPQSRTLLLRYDDFVEDPEAALSRLADLGIVVRRDDGLRERLSRLGIRPSRPGLVVPPAVSGALRSQCAPVAELLELPL
jgi:Sulfotransferase family